MAAKIEPTELTIHYVKSPQYRTVYVDGALGGKSPRGDVLSVALFSERHAIPETVTHAVEPLPDSSSFKLGGEVRRTGKLGVVRELEASLVLSFTAAKQLHEWLTKRLEEFELLTEEPQEKSDA